MRQVAMKNGILQLGLCALALTSIGLGGCKDSSSTGGGTTGSSTSGSTGSGATAGDTIKIGLVASLNGDLLPWGQDSEKGALLAVEEINAAGGIGGKKIELIRQDSNSKAEEGKTAAEKLVSDGVIGVLGEVASGITMQIKEVTVPKGVPLVAIGATNPKVTAENAQGKVFRVCYTDDLQGPVMAKFAYDFLGLRNVGVMTDQAQPYSQGLSKSFIEAFKNLGGKIVDEQSYESKQTQFRAQITAMKSKAPQGIFISGYFTEVGPMARQIRDQGMKDVKLFGGDGWDSSDIVSSGGDAIVGSYFCNHYNNMDDRPQVKDFLDQWKASNGGNLPGTTMGALAYDAANLMIDALKRMAADGKEINSANLTEYIANTEKFAGVSGDITMKGMNGDPPKRALVVQIEKDGSQKFVQAYEPNEVLKK